MGLLGEEICNWQIAPGYITIVNRHLVKPGPKRSRGLDEICPPSNWTSLLSPPLPQSRYPKEKGQSGIAVIEGIDGLHDSYVHASLEFIRRDRYSATRWNLKRYRKF